MPSACIVDTKILPRPLKNTYILLTTYLAQCASFERKKTFSVKSTLCTGANPTTFEFTATTPAL
jgi:hypothetical protein